MKFAERRLLRDALMRYMAFHDGEPLREAWTGLGYKTEYRPVLDSGLMEWANYEPPKRQMAWLRLTEEGAKIVQNWIDNGYTYSDAIEGKWPED